LAFDQAVIEQIQVQADFRGGDLQLQGDFKDNRAGEFLSGCVFHDRVAYAGIDPGIIGVFLSETFIRGVGHGGVLSRHVGSAHPQKASFGPERRFRSVEILGIARYACGFKIAHALR
jgi:hypothetical protein